MNVKVLGRKEGMTRIYDKSGVSIPVTVIIVEPNFVVQLKTEEKEGYQAAQLGAFDQKESRLSKPLQGHFKKAGVSPKKVLHEFRYEGDLDGIEIGKELGVSRFQEGQRVDVIAKSKGKGFQGVMKRHGFHGQPASHGSKMHRRPGGIAMGSTPGRVPKNTKMPGQTGNSRVTIQNLEVIQIRESDHALLISGAVPGHRGSLVLVRSAIKGQPREKQKQVEKAINPLKASKKNK